MGLVLRVQSTNTNGAGNALSIKNAALSYPEGDSNFIYLLTNMSGSNIAITGSTGIIGNTSILGNVTTVGSLSVNATGGNSVNLLGLTTSSQPWILTYNSSSGQLFYTSSTAFSGNAPVLTSPITTNITVGNLAAGTTLTAGTLLEDIFRQMLITYIPPTISGLSMTNGGASITSPRDVNNPFTITNAVFSANDDDPNGRYAYSASWASSGADAPSSSLSYYFGNDVLLSSNNLTIGGPYTLNRATSAGSISFAVSAKRPDNLATISTGTSVSFQWRNYFAASSTVINNDATAQSVIAGAILNPLSTSKAWTVTCTSANNAQNNFTYIIYPSSFGLLTGIIQNGALPTLYPDGSGAWTNLGTFNVTNPFGATVSVRVYKSNSDAAFASGTTLAIT